MSKAIITPSDGVIAPHVKRTHPVSFLFFFALVASVVSIGVFSLWVPKAPYGVMVEPREMLTLCLKILAWAASGGMLFSSQAPVAVAGMAASPVALAIKAKALASLALGGVAGWLVARDQLKPRDDYEHIRGARLIAGKDAIKELAKAVPLGQEDYIHPSIKVSPRAWGNGLICLGSPGSGKSTILQPFILKAMARDEMFMTLDVKREQIQMLGPKAFYLAPWLKGKHSLVIDIGQDITTEEQAQAFADNFIRVDATDAHGAVWKKSANSVFAALVKKLVKDKPLNWGWKDLAEQLELGIDEWRDILQEMSPAQAKILEGSENTSTSVAFSVATDLRQVGAIAKMFTEVEKFGGTKFSIRQWMTDPTYPVRQIVLCHTKEQSVAAETLIPFVIDYCGTMISGLPNGIKEPRWFFLDELAQLAPVGSLAQFYEVGRSRRITLVLALQDFAQLEKTYRKDAEILMSNASTKIICKTTPSRAQERLAQGFGTREVAYRGLSTSSSGQGTSHSASLQEKTLPLILPSQLSSDLGPVGAAPDGKGGTKPTAIRALIAPAKSNVDTGDVYIVDWPVLDIPKQREEPRPLPSQHPLALWALHLLREKTSPLAVNIAVVREEIKNKIWRYDDIDLAGLLYSADLIDEEGYQRLLKIGFKAFIRELKETEAQEQPRPRANAAPTHAVEAAQSAEALDELDDLDLGRDEPDQGLGMG